MAGAGDHERLKREAHEWVARLTSGQATATDGEAVKRWCETSPAHARALAEANLLWQTLGPVAEQVKRASDATTGHLARRALLGGALAASAAAAAYLAVRPPLDLWPSLSALAADYRTGPGERRQIAVAGVSIELNTRTSVNVGKTPGMDRLELVSGEAAISTARPLAEPLVVLAAGGRVSATDANFNLRCDRGPATVTCLKGAVDIEYRGDAATLSERQQLAYGGGRLGAAAAVDPVLVTAWRDGRLVFQGTPLAEVIDEVNRYRSGRIILINAALGRRVVQASFPLDRTDELVTLVREAYGARVTVLPGGVVLLS
jgi:transmembrane sensor